MSSTQPLPDYYAILEVEPSATEKDIEKAYRYLVLLYHPDRLASMPEHVRQRAEDKLKMINAAREVLCDARRRAEYDTERLAERHWAHQTSWRQGSQSAESPRTDYSRESQQDDEEEDEEDDEEEPEDIRRSRTDSREYYGHINYSESASGSGSRRRRTRDRAPGRRVSNQERRPAPQYGTVYVAHPLLHDFRPDMPVPPPPPPPRLHPLLAAMLVIIALVTNLTGGAAETLINTAESLHPRPAAAAGVHAGKTPQPTATLVTTTPPR